ncbi:MAG TPA: sugar nucleotide-binding protein, partial [Candidatus Bathyarchaeia archaeon]
MRINHGGSPSQRRRCFPLRLGRSDGRPTRLLVTGASGLLGGRTAEVALARGHQVYSCYKEHRPAHGNPTLLDQTNEYQVRRAILEIRPEAIINAAAVTDVDLCEEDGNTASLVNMTSVGYLANAAKECESFLVQVSTDYVFDGEKGRYSES